MSDKRPKVGIGVLVLRDGKVLLSQRKRTFAVGSWAPPGGHLEFGETFEGCAKREVTEETGLTVASAAVGTVTSTVYDDEQEHYVSVIMVAQSPDGEPHSTEPDKHGNWQWFPWDALPSPLFPPVQQAVDQGFDPRVPAAGGDVARFKELAARAQADLQNAKARVEREREEIGKFAAESLILRLLPTIDNLQRAMKHLPDALKDDEWAKGVLATEQELMRRLSDAGLKRIEALGQPIDPLRHEVLMAEDGGEGVVVEVFEDGYELSGKVLRPAKVKAGRGGGQAMK